MSYEKIENEIVDKIYELELMARSEVDRHWKYHMEANLNEEPKNKARLNVWVRRRKEVLEIYWTHLKFVNPRAQGKSKIHYHHIPKGRGNAYRYASLAGKAKPWEIDQVWEIEEKMAEIRSEYTKLRKALWYIRKAKKSTLTSESEAQPSEEAEAPESEANHEGEMA